MPVEEEIEQLPQYEAPPPKYDSVVKEDQQQTEMRDLERGESSGGAAGDGLPEYGERQGEERVTVVRVATDASRVGSGAAGRQRFWSWGRFGR
jgi:hypothetical protein